MNQHGLKIAFAKGYHAGMMGAPFYNPYEDFDMRVQFNYGFRSAVGEIGSLYEPEDLELTI
jgi:ribosome modulation factor